MKKTSKKFYGKMAITVIALGAVVGTGIWYAGTLGKEETVTVYKASQKIAEGEQITTGNVGTFLSSVEISKSDYALTSGLVTNPASVCGYYTACEIGQGALVYSYQFSETADSTGTAETYTLMSFTLTSSSCPSGLEAASWYTVHGVMTINGVTYYQNICYAKCISIADQSALSSASGTSVSFSVVESALSTLEQYKSNGKISFLENGLSLTTETSTDINAAIGAQSHGAYGSSVNVVTEGADYSETSATDSIKSLNVLVGTGFDFDWTDFVPSYVSLNYRYTDGSLYYATNSAGAGVTYNGSYYVNNSASDRRIDYDSATGIYSFHSEKASQFSQPGYYFFHFRADEDGTGNPADRYYSFLLLSGTDSSNLEYKSGRLDGSSFVESYRYSDADETVREAVRNMSYSADTGVLSVADGENRIHPTCLDGVKAFGTTGYVDSSFVKVGRTTTVGFSSEKSMQTYYPDASCFVGSSSSDKAFDYRTGALDVKSFYDSADYSDSSVMASLAVLLGIDDADDAYSQLGAYFSTGCTLKFGKKTVKAMAANLEAAAEEVAADATLATAGQALGTWFLMDTFGLTSSEIRSTFFLSPGSFDQMMTALAGGNASVQGATAFSHSDEYLLLSAPAGAEDKYSVYDTEAVADVLTLD